MKKLKQLFKKGDTLIEVTFSIAVFSLVSVISIQIMDRDLAMIQGTLEYEMARNEIDAQAEALRFIQNSYLSERELAESEREYMNLWLQLSRTNQQKTSNGGTGLANFPAKISQYTSVDCKSYYETNTGSIHKIFNDQAFVINTRNLSPKKEDISNTIVQSKVGSTEYKKKFVEAELYPRIIYTEGSSPATNDEASLAEVFGDYTNSPDAQERLRTKNYDDILRAEGIWVIAARQCKTTEDDCKNESPEFYDFHIRTCWFAPGHERPSTIATTIRLYNPEYTEDQR